MICHWRELIESVVVLLSNANVRWYDWLTLMWICWLYIRHWSSLGISYRVYSSNEKLFSINSKNFCVFFSTMTCLVLYWMPWCTDQLHLQSDNYSWNSIVDSTKFSSSLHYWIKIRPHCFLFIYICIGSTCCINLLLFGTKNLSQCLFCIFP